jgi:type III restriction enzyme
MQERLAFDIAIPLTKPVLSHNVRKISTLDPMTFEPIYDQPELAEPVRVTLKMEFMTTETEVHQEDVAAGTIPIAQELLSVITNKVMQRAKLSTVFAELYPIVQRYVATRCFGKTVDVDAEAIRSDLCQFEVQEGIAKYLARKISELTVEKRILEFENAGFTLSEGTTPFTWRRNLPPLEAKRTVFNYVATYNDFERRFAEFLDKASDVLRFASLGTTEQGDSGTQFRVDYLKPSGAIGFYHPDWVVVQKTAKGEVHWIIETKGRVWEGTEAKDAAIRDWCQRITEQTERQWEFARINQSTFQASKPKTLAEAVQRVE